MKSLALKAAMAAIGFFMVSAAKADVQFEQRGSVAYLHSHRIRPGDEDTVRAFLEGPQGQGVRIIYMDSRGGNPAAAMAIGNMIREHGLDTGFNPSKGDRCPSACTAMFLGGVHRYYVGGEHIRDAANSKLGLGFHPPRHPSPEGEDTMNDYYRQMGAPGATALRYHIYPATRSISPSRATADVARGHCISPAAAPRCVQVSPQGNRRLRASATSFVGRDTALDRMVLPASQDAGHHAPGTRKEDRQMIDSIHIPIFPCSGNRTIAVNPALVRAVETQASGGVKIIFDREHELMVQASLHDVMIALWNPKPVAEIKDMTVL